MPIGRRIRVSRKELGLSQTELAARVSVTQPTVANWETGAHDPRPMMLAKLAESLNVSLGWLASGERSQAEQDKHPAAAYLRRPVQHTPLLPWRMAVQFASPTPPDPHSLAEDVFPVTSKRTTLFGAFIDDPAMTYDFPGNTLVVIDYGDKTLQTDKFYAIVVDNRAVARIWNGGTGRFHAGARNSNGASDAPPPTPERQTQIIGRIVYALRVL